MARTSAAAPVVSLADRALRPGAAKRLRAAKTGEFPESRRSANGAPDIVRPEKPFSDCLTAKCLISLATPAGIEPAANSLEGYCSIR